MIPVLSGIVAKILIIVEGVLDYFVTLDSAATADHCGGSYGLTGSLTLCGEEFVATVAQVVNGVMEFITPILGGLTVEETAP